MTMETESGDMSGRAEGSTSLDGEATTDTCNASTGFLRRRNRAWLRRDELWIDLLILLAAALLRLWALELKPAHFDEGVNGYFVDEMTKRGLYSYDPTN